jgi:hypothetical protein
MAFSACSRSGNSLNGTWVHESIYDVNADSYPQGYITVMETIYTFSGKNYTAIFKYSYYYTNEYKPGSGYTSERKEAPYNEEIDFEQKGAFFITDDKIEFAPDGGKIFVVPFSRTENTIVIERSRYTRQ